MPQSKNDIYLVDILSKFIYMLWLIRQMVIRHRWRCSGRCRGKRGNERWLPLISKHPKQENTQNYQENNVQFLTSITNRASARYYLCREKFQGTTICLLRCLQIRWVLNANDHKVMQIKRRSMMLLNVSLQWCTRLASFLFGNPHEQNILDLSTSNWTSMHCSL